MMQIIAGIYGIALGLGMGYAAFAAVTGLQGTAVCWGDWFYTKLAQITAGGFLGALSIVFLTKGYALLFDMTLFIPSPAWLDH